MLDFDELLAFLHHLFNVCLFFLKRLTILKLQFLCRFRTRESNYEAQQSEDQQNNNHVDPSSSLIDPIDGSVIAERSNESDAWMFDISDNFVKISLASKHAGGLRSGGELDWMVYAELLLSSSSRESRITAMDGDALPCHVLAIRSAILTQVEKLIENLCISSGMLWILIMNVGVLYFNLMSRLSVSGGR